MKNTILKTVCNGAFVILTLVTFGLTALIAQDEVKPESKSGQVEQMREGNNSQSIVGVWLTQVTRRNCVTGEPIAAPSRIQFTFAEGGTLLETIGPSIFRSAGNGIWKREHGWNEYSWTLRFMRYDAAGAFVGSGVVKVNAELDETGNNFTTTATNVFLDVNGNVIGSGCATSVSTRFEG